MTDFIHHGRKQCIAIFEVHVERAARHACIGADFVEAGTVDALLSEERHRR